MGTNQNTKRILIFLALAFVTPWAAILFLGPIEEFGWRGRSRHRLVEPPYNFQSGSGVTDVLMPVDNGGISRQKIGQNAVIPLGESHRIAAAEMTMSSDTPSIR